VFQVHCQAVVPIFFGDLVELVSIVVGGVIHQHVERPILIDQLPDDRR
jgi:hypothetical protein